MSETAQAVATEATATDTSAHQPASTPESNTTEPNWLPSRLERERKTIARRFGAESLDEVEQRLAKAKEIEQERMSEVERLRARTAELEVAAKERDEFRSAIAAQAADAMASLTQEQRDAVEELADGSPAKQLKAILKLKPTWKAQEQPKPPLPPPVSTSAATPGPNPTAPVTNNHLATWERLKRDNPMEAAHYFLLHQVEIVEARKARGQ